MGMPSTNPRTQRWLASTRSAGRVAVCVTGELFPPASCQHCGRSQDLFGGIVAWGAGDAAARMGARTTQVQPGNGRRIARPTGHRAQGEQLVEAQIAMKDV